MNSPCHAETVSYTDLAMHPSASRTPKDNVALRHWLGLTVAISMQNSHGINRHVPTQPLSYKVVVSLVALGFLGTHTGNQKGDIVNQGF